MRRTLLLAILIVPILAACSMRPPPKLAKGLGANVTYQPDPDWDQRLRERFPVGSEESLLLAELRRDHFVFDPTRPGHASYPQPRFPCRQDWRVDWKAEGGRITEIAGTHNGACL